MYQKYASVLAAFTFVLAAAWFCVRGVQINRYAAANLFDTEPLQCVEEILDYEKKQEAEKLTAAVGQKPVIGLCVLEQEEEKACPAANFEQDGITRQDYETLLKIVEAEAGCEDAKGKLLVANVVLNRVEDEEFPDTVTEVVYQKSGGTYQFSPVADGRIDRVKISEETVRAVELALTGEDNSRGALYFAARSAADPENMRWFDENLVRLFAYGGHEFFG